MKLLLCKKCNHLFSLGLKHRECECGAIGGRYLDKSDAVYYGKQGVRLGINNNRLPITPLPEEADFEYSLTAPFLFGIENNKWFTRITKIKYYKKLYDKQRTTLKNIPRER